MIKRTPRVSLIAELFINLIEPQVDWADFLEGEHRFIRRFDLDSRPEIKEGLDKIKDFVKKNYMLSEDDIWDCFYYKDGLYVGNEYIFTKDENIQGKVSIIFSEILTRKKKDIGTEKAEILESWRHGKTYYVFRTWIREKENYTKLCKDLLKLSNELELKMVRSVYGQGIGLPQDVCLEPVFCRGVDVFDVESLKNFMEKIDSIAKKYYLYTSSDIRTNFCL